MKPETLKFEDVLERHGVLVYTNVGTSMMPLLRQGRDLMEIRKKGTERCKKYDVVLYKRNGRYILHRILKVRAKDYVIAGDNNYFLEYGITDEDILGVLTGVVRDEKRIDVETDRLYRLYVHIWCDVYPVRMAILYGKSLFYRIMHIIKRFLKK